MIFNSIVFGIFIACFFLLWPLFKQKNTSRWIYIIVASLFFYGWWNWYYIFVLIFSGLIDFGAAIFIVKFKKQWQKKLCLILSLIVNLGLLATFKYSGFIVENLNLFLLKLGYTGALLSINLPEFFLVLPIGISFYTFQSMSYTIDVYKGNLQPTKNILHFFAFLTLFPQLVAGPIERATNLLPQVAQKPKDLNESERFQALCLIIWGYCKKMLLADNLAPIVNQAFATPYLSNSCLFWWGIALGFAFQIYGDFSGYTDIARGLARWMGISLMKNFDFPYFSTNIQEFWKRWHISLSSWFKDYVYIPLGGSRNGNIRTYINLWLTLGLSGLWHGAGWNFIFWGLAHAFFSSIERCFKICSRLKNIGFGGAFTAWTLTFLQILITWVFFRSESLSQAFNILKIMFSFSGLHCCKRVILWCFILFLFEGIYLLYGRKICKLKVNRFVQCILLAALFWICLFFRGPSSQFIYFQF